MNSPSEYTDFIRQKAAELGFDACGIAPSAYLADEAPRLEKWLEDGFHAGMQYMANHKDIRLDPQLLVSNARSVIVLLSNYFPPEMMKPEAPYRISAYAYGQDYHEVIRGKMKLMAHSLSEQIPGITIRSFVDSAPLLERSWATRAGLGWIGKNSLMITRKQGSFFFLSELITDLELQYDEPFGGNYCGDCNRCMTACPTGALVEPFRLDAGKCISYQTIENKGEIPEELRGKYENWIFGCDICQLVCPWNRFSTVHKEPVFLPKPELRDMTAEKWENIEKEQFDVLFRKSAVKRAKFDGLKRNIAFLKK